MDVRTFRSTVLVNVVKLDLLHQHFFDEHVDGDGQFRCTWLDLLNNFFLHSWFFHI